MSSSTPALAHTLFDVPEDVARASELLRIMLDNADGDGDNVVLPVPFPVGALRAFVERGIVTWDVGVLKAGTFFLVDGFREAVHRTLRLFGDPSQIAMARKAMMLYPRVYNEWVAMTDIEEIYRAGLLHKFPPSTWMSHLGGFVKYRHMDVVRHILTYHQTQLVNAAVHHLEQTGTSSNLLSSVEWVIRKS